MARRYFAVVLGCILLHISGQAQKQGYEVAKNAQTFYAEGGGAGILTFNYDQRLQGSDGLGFRAGVGGYGFLKNGVFTIPLGINYLKGSNGQYAELGAGICPVLISSGYKYFDNDKSIVAAFINFGYRYQPETKGLTYRAFICPLFTPQGAIPFYGGASIGFKF